MSGYVCYLRVSTSKQAEGGSSLPAQRSACLDGIQNLHPEQTIIHAWYDGATSKLIEGEDRPVKPGELFIPLYQDAGVSGAAPLDECPGLCAALERLPKGGTFVVAKLDRLDRDDLKFALAEQIITDKKARLLSIAGEGTEGQKPYHVFLRDILKAVRKHERLLTKERVFAAIRERRRQRLVVGQIPRGYALAPDGKHIEPRTVSEWETNQKIIELWESGRTFDEIAEDIRELSGGYRSRTGRFLAKEQIRQVVLHHVPDYEKRK